MVSPAVALKPVMVRRPVEVARVSLHLLRMSPRHQLRSAHLVLDNVGVPRRALPVLRLVVVRTPQPIGVLPLETQPLVLHRGYGYDVGSFVPR